MEANNALGEAVVSYIGNNFLREWKYMLNKFGLSTALQIITKSIGDVNALVQEVGTVDEKKKLKGVHDIEILTNSVSAETLNLMVKKISNRILFEINTLVSKSFGNFLKKVQKITDTKAYMKSITPPILGTFVFTLKKQVQEQLPRNLTQIINEEILKISSHKDLQEFLHNRSSKEITTLHKSIYQRLIKKD